MHIYQILLLAALVNIILGENISRNVRNSITVTNQGSKTIYVGFFKYNGMNGEARLPERRLRLPPRASQTVYLPHGWEGTIQKLSGVPSDPATWAEIQFDCCNTGTIACDISLMQGYNGAMQFTSQDGSLRTGFTNDLFSEAPQKFKTKDSRGNNVLQSIEPFSGVTNLELVDYYRRKILNGNVYLLPNDHTSTHITYDNRISLSIY